MNFKEEYTDRVEKIEKILKKYLPEKKGYQRTIMEAMEYSLMAGGKRLRPMLMWESYRLFGGEGAAIEPFMAAIEMIHTYSLVHDDLPAMDNDEYRRGRKTTHIVYGEDMGILIGKRGQTLDSLQYLTSLVVNKGKSNYIRVKLDTEDYRKRRKETLENLARGIAYKVRKTRKPVILEPMNPYERRIIHSALQGNKFVETVSEGEEPYRHVVVKLKRN